MSEELTNNEEYNKSSQSSANGTVINNNEN